MAIDVHLLTRSSRRETFSRNINCLDQMYSIRKFTHLIIWFCHRDGYTDLQSYVLIICIYVPHHSCDKDFIIIITLLSDFRLQIQRYEELSDTHLLFNMCEYRRFIWKAVMRQKFNISLGSISHISWPSNITV